MPSRLAEPRAVLIAFAALLAPAPTRAQDTARGPVPVALPAEAQLLLRADAPRVAADGAALPGAAGAWAIRAEPGSSPSVGVFLRARRGTETALRARGVRVGTRAGDWLTARVPLDRLGELAGVPGVTAVEVAARARAHTDTSVIEIGAAAARIRTEFDRYQGGTGRGTIVGIVDTGLDYRHPDFLEDDTGRSRVLWLWDQTLAGGGPGTIGGSTFDFGLECDNESLTRGTCPSADLVGHGTHVAGIAAGDGSGARVGVPSFGHAGVAPGADLVIVKSDYSLASVVEAVDYVFRRAAELDRPAVVNLSLGTMLGPHDGTAAASLAIDALAGPGRVVVASAGNEGDNRNGSPAGRYASLHAEQTVALGETGTVSLAIHPHAPWPGPGNDILLVQAFHEAADTFDVVITRPNGSIVTLSAAQASLTNHDPGGSVVAYHGAVAGDTILGPALTLGSFAPASAAHTVALYLGEWVTGGGSPSPGVWRVGFRRVRGSGSGRVDAYVPFSQLRGGFTFDQGATNRRLVATPADARSVIAVGAYSTRLRWRSVDGRTYTFAVADSVPIGDVLLFSSPGPTRDGRTKPEITAPGRVFAALSRHAMFPMPLVAPDSAHVLLEGTSMAAPHVTGAVALLLSRRPRLTPAAVHTALTGSARQDAYTAVSHGGDDGRAPSASWGFGKLNVTGALGRVGPTPGNGVVVALPLPPALAAADSRRGALLALQRLRLGATDAESLHVRRIDARVAGRDAAFRLALVHDLDRDGRVSDGEPVVARGGEVALAGTESALAVELPVGALVVPRGGTADVILAGELSGATPNGAAFRGSIAAGGVVGSGARTNLSIAFGGVHGPAVAVRTTLLAEGERVNLAQNPVRAAPLVVNFDAPLRRATVYDFAGRAVRTLRADADARRIEWDLRGDGGTPVANGAYLLVIDLEQGTVRRTLFVAR